VGRIAVEAECSINPMLATGYERNVMATVNELGMWINQTMYERVYLRSTGCVCFRMFAWFSLRNILSMGRRFLPQKSDNGLSYLKAPFT
jgi:hypothetical protein